MEIPHGRLETLRARQLTSPRQRHAQREVIHIAVSGRGGVGDRIREAVSVFVVFEAGGAVEGRIGDEAGVGLAYHGVLELVVGAAAGVGAELGGEGGH